jgi:tripartite-type tricarboxylate transporter receptor subunit TctC
MNNTAICAALAAMAAMSPAAVSAQQYSQYPARPIRVIVPSQAGGGADIVARAIAVKMGEAWNQQVVVDNRIGIVGAEIAAKAPPDGYTLMFTTSALAVRESVFTTLPYNTLRDFLPVSQAVTQSNLLVSHPAVPVKNVGELVALAKSKPGQLNWGSGGNATSNHLAGELFTLLARIEVVHVPYKGVPVALTDTMAGRMQYTFGSPVSTLPHVKEGRLRLLAVTTAKRTPGMPDVPTIAEFVQGYEFTGWMGLLAPAKVPHPVVDRLYREVARIVQLPDVKQRFLVDAAEPVGSSPEEFRTFIKGEIGRWTKVAREAAIKVD